MAHPPAIYDLSDSTALVTGAAGDIGRAVALRLAGSGARLALTDMPAASERLEATAERCSEINGDSTVMTITADVTDSADVERCLEAASPAVGVADLVFNNAGYQGLFRATPDYPEADLASVMDVNVAGVFSVLQATADRMRAAAITGSIVNSASMAGVDGAPNMAAYSASKAAVIALTQSAAKDLAPLGIRVNAVSPGFIGPGAMWDRQIALQAAADSQYYDSDPDRVGDQMMSQVPMRRCGKVDEVAAAVLWLLSEESSYITGQNIPISGGI